jgi:capsular polysaccharide biosynthesis protein
MADEPSFSEPQSQRQKFVSTQAEDPSEGQDSQIILMDYIRVLWNRRYLILVGSLLVASTFLVLSLREVDVYEAKATLILQPPQFSTDLKPPPLSVATLKAILESDFITSQLVGQLIKEDVIEVDASVDKIKGMLEIVIYPDREQNQSYLPLIDLVVRSDSPEEPAAVANAWAEIFLFETTELTRRSQEGTLEFITTQFPLIKNSLMSLESQLQEMHNQYDLEFIKTERSWNLRIADAGSEINGLLRDHEEKTEHLRLEFLSRWKPDLMKGELKINEFQLAESEQELFGAGLAIQTQKDTLTHIKKEIQSQPQYLVLSKAMTDEALWNKIGDVNSGLPEELNEKKLRSELLNPIYQELLSRLTTTQINYELLAPKREYLINAIERSRKMIDERNSLIAQTDYELFVLLKDRELGLKSLQLEGEAQLEIMKREFEINVARLEREKGLLIDQLEREILSVRVTYQNLAGRYETAKLAKADVESDVKVGALAVKPNLPMAKNTRFNVLTGLGVGFILSVMLAFVLEYVQLISLTVSAERKLEGSPSRSLGS